MLKLSSSDKLALRFPSRAYPKCRCQRCWVALKSSEVQLCEYCRIIVEYYLDNNVIISSMYDRKKGIEWFSIVPAEEIEGNAEVENITNEVNKWLIRKKL